MIYIPKRVLAHRNLTATDKILYGIFRDMPEISNKEITIRTAISTNTIANRVANLRDNGLVNVTNDRRNGRWHRKVVVR